MIRVQNKSLLTQLTQHYNERARKQALLGEFLTFWVDSNARVMGSAVVEANNVSLTPDFKEFQQEGNSTMRLLQLDLNRISDFPFGERFTRLFWDWFKHIPWLEASCETSLLEIYISFALETGHMTPIYNRCLKKKTQNRRTAYTMRDEAIRADLVRSDLSSQLRIFIKFFKWLGSFFEFDSSSCHRGKLKRLGFHNPTMHLLRAVQLPNHVKVADSLWRDFHAGRRSTLSMKGVW